MGQGYSYRCEHCDYTIEYMQGVGFMFPIDADRILSDMQAGKMGKHLITASNIAAEPEVNHSCELNKCERCGELRADMKIELYDAGNLPFEKQHYCRKCRGKMHITNEDEAQLCPHCGKPLVIGSMLMWD